MPVLSLDCHLPHNTPHIPSRYNNEQTTKQTKTINNSYIYIHISCKCDTNRAGHFTLDAYASRPVACVLMDATNQVISRSLSGWMAGKGLLPAKMHWATWITHVYLRALQGNQATARLLPALTTIPWRGNGTWKIPRKWPLEGHVTIAIWVSWRTVYCRMSRVTLRYMALCTSQHTKRFVK